MGGKGSGRKPGFTLTAEQRSKNPMIQSAHRNVDPAENRKTIAYAMDLMQVKEADRSDPADIDRAFSDYLGVCSANGIRPNVAGLCTCYGMDRRRLHGAVTGATRPPAGFTPESLAELRKVYTFLNGIHEAEMLDDKGNPAKYIFLAKNNFGYVDQTERISIRKDATDEIRDPKQVAAKYADMVELPGAGDPGDAGEPGADS